MKHASSCMSLDAIAERVHGSVYAKAELGGNGGGDYLGGLTIIRSPNELNF